MRERHGMFVVEGTKNVSDTMGAFRLEAIVATPSWIDTHGEILSHCERDKIYSAPRQTIDKISSLTTPSEVLAVFAISDYNNNLKAPENAMCLMLDNVQDPGNLGTIIRTAAWFGFNTIYASKGTADVFNPKTIQATMGALSKVRIVYADLEEVAKLNPDYKLVSTTFDGEDISTARLPQENVFLILGNEGNGISEAIQNIADISVTIPPFDTLSHPESLNVGIAAAVCMAFLRRHDRPRI